jgi:hypothetical protein
MRNILLIVAMLCVLSGCSRDVILDKYEFEVASITHYEVGALLALKKILGGGCNPYIERVSGGKLSQNSVGLLDEQGGDWHPNSKKVLGIYGDIVPQTSRRDVRDEIRRKVQSNLPEGYKASLVSRQPVDSPSSVRYSVIIQKVCGRNCSGKFAPFDAQLWKANASAGLPMAETLVHQQSLIGLPSLKMVSLLGDGVKTSVPTGEGSGGHWQVYDYKIKNNGLNESNKNALPAHLKVLLSDDRVTKAWIVNGS